jgi:hypothetical protein
VRELWENHNQKVKIGSFVIFALIWAYSTLFTQSLPIEESILFAVAFLTISVDMIANNVLEIKNRLSSPTQLHRRSTGSVPDLRQTLKESNIMNVYFLEYNSTSVSELLDAAIDEGCDVHLLMKDPRRARNNIQKRNIASQITTIYEKYYNYDRLTIHFYSKPSSVKARLLQGHSICLGWYTFDERTDERGPKQVWGKDNPMVCVSSNENPDNFGSTYEWFKDIYHDLWTTGVSLSELYNSEDYAELREQNVVNENWIQRVSGKTESSQEELFHK